MSEDNSNLLSKMFQKTIDSEEYELLTINTICALIREDYEMVDKAIELILDKIKSENVNQSLRALEILGECMTNGGDEFQDKISKIRFLNRLIELVSKKYNGEKTPSEVRNKIMDYLLLWTTVYPDRTKIKLVYDKLCNEGVEHQIAHKSITGNNASRKCSFLDEKADEKLKALLNSKNPKDLKLANLLIQYYVNQDAKRNELISSQNLELDKAKNVIDLLNEMINNNLNNSRSSDVGESMRELYERCLQFSPVIQRLPGIIDEKDEKLLAKALEINDDLSEVIMKYRALPVAENLTEEEEEQQQENINECKDILLNPVSDLENAIQMNDAKDQNDYSSSKDLIFDNPFPPVAADNLLQLTLLEPVPVYKEQKTQNQTENTDLLQQKSDKSETETSSFSYVNELVEDILGKHSNETARIIGAFKKKQPTKVSINELKAKSTNEMSNKLDEIPRKTNRTESLKIDQNKNINKDDDFKDNLLVNASGSEQLNFEDMKLFSDISFSPNSTCINSNSASDQNDKNFNKNETELKLKFDSSQASSSDDEELIQMSDDKLLNEINYNVNSNKKIENILMCKKNLADLSLDLNSVKIKDNSPQIEVINDIQGLRMTCKLADNRLENDIFVIVISIVNQNQFPINNLSLDAAVKKPCRLRLLEPSKNKLPAFFVPLQLPTDDIKQILLIYNPTKKSIDVTFILSYYYPDDPDIIKEPAVAKNIPYYIN